MLGMAIGELLALLAEPEDDNAVRFREFTCKVRFYAGKNNIKHPVAVFDLEYGELKAIAILG